MIVPYWDICQPVNSPDSGLRRRPAYSGRMPRPTRAPADQGDIDVHVRLPQELNARLRREARRDRRSLNAEVMVLLEEALAARRRLAEPPSTYPR